MSSLCILEQLSTCDLCVRSVAQFLTNIVESSGALDPTQLCIQEGKSVWVIYADLVCVDYDGNVADTALLALMSALKDLVCVYRAHISLRSAL